MRPDSPTLTLARAPLPRQLAGLATAALLAACHGGGSGSGGAATDMGNAPEMTLGSPRAKVSLVEDASGTCVHCAPFDTASPAWSWISTSSTKR